ncbi:hypothetical protein [Bacteroides sp. 519]|uniref:hypothetical protein n=1 Tax=Bacteroides sp. 519 TaxID=2302937 RepID=UPI0013D5D2AD|nr:hypothetical protein [Bacteroides sp. 519]
MDKEVIQYIVNYFGYLLTDHERLAMTHPEHGESMSPYGQASCVNLHLINETTTLA